MQALENQGMISDPRGRAESIQLTPEGLVRAKELAYRLFSG